MREGYKAPERGEGVALGRPSPVRAGKIKDRSFELFSPPHLSTQNQGCVMALLIPTLSKFNPNLINIQPQPCPNPGTL
jgi:hypothetical protein